MSIGVFFFKPADDPSGCLKIGNLLQLTSKEAGSIRTEIDAILPTGFQKIYIDASLVQEVDLGGINEIIHSGYRLQQAGKHLIVVYRKASSVEKWIQTTGLDRFVQTAIIPA